MPKYPTLEDIDLATAVVPWLESLPADQVVYGDDGLTDCVLSTYLRANGFSFAGVGFRSVAFLDEDRPTLFFDLSPTHRAIQLWTEECDDFSAGRALEIAREILGPRGWDSVDTAPED